ncbi:MAG: rRNA maturation RNase YbeY [Lachnospiraceae bacterium]|nr:rRNA maturation RNase YbeY [Lachnospiraceae bacterium]MDE7204920.1 rRNA maturation RNase YbeY [Lachnospiraceae bacterium]
MTFYVESETDRTLPFDVEEVAGKVIAEALDYENCPYEVSVNVLLTDNEGIHELNKQHRGIDRPTDVLSFPNVDYENPADFSMIENNIEDYFDPENGELCLGDIVISVDKVYEQSEEYGHSLIRECAFLVAHSMLHLLGYDHMEPGEAEVMEQKQEEILDRLGITRDEQGAVK